MRPGSLGAGGQSWGRRRPRDLPGEQSPSPGRPRALGAHGPGAVEPHCRAQTHGSLLPAFAPSPSSSASFSDPLSSLISSLTRSLFLSLCRFPLFLPPWPSLSLSPHPCVCPPFSFCETVCVTSPAAWDMSSAFVCPVPCPPGAGRNGPALCTNSHLQG